jgi:hypothetical protein
MVDFKKDTWLYALIAAIVAIIAILTPWGSITILGTTYQSWMGGGVTFITPGDVWTGAGLSLWTFGLTVFSIAILLIYGVNAWRGKEFKWDWLMYLLAGLVLLIFPILTLVLEGTTGAVIGFAPIGLIIAGIIAIGAFCVDKFVGGE